MEKNSIESTLNDIKKELQNIRSILEPKKVDVIVNGQVVGLEWNPEGKNFVLPTNITLSASTLSANCATLKD
jgi:archaellum component FlaF (FlaF/FlaG flagellin family)